MPMTALMTLTTILVTVEDDEPEHPAAALTSDGTSWAHGSPEASANVGRAKAILLTTKAIDKVAVLMSLVFMNLLCD